MTEDFFDKKMAIQKESIPSSSEGEESEMLAGQQPDIEIRGS
jgi:hypothetical protein